MARKVEIRLVDDLDGSQNAETVHFGLNGIHYEIDLSAQNRAELKKVLDKYVKVARRTRAHSAEDASEIRAWARGKGYEVNKRGRLQQELIDAYRKENS